MVTALATSAMAYLIARIGFFYRSRAHSRASRVVLDAFFDQPAPRMTVLVPSYQEDERVIRTTLLSAALQEYPELQVVLLIDDPQQPTVALTPGHSANAFGRFGAARSVERCSAGRGGAAAHDAIGFGRREHQPPHKPKLETATHEPRRSMPNGGAPATMAGQAGGRRGLRGGDALELARRRTRRSWTARLMSTSQR